MPLTDIFDESVFALSFKRNLTVSIKSKDKRQHRSSVFVCVFSTLNDTGVGIVSVYLLLGFVRTSFEINEKAPHFLFDHFATSSESG